MPIPASDVSQTEVTAHECDDWPVVTRILAGDRDGFAQLTRRYNQRLFRVARAIVHSDPEAEDVVQQAYVSVYLNLHQFEGRSSFSTWITRIAIHEAYALVRAGKRAAGIAPDDSSNEWLAGTYRATDPEQQLSTREHVKLLEAAIAALLESYRVPLVLREVEGLSTAETAQCLELTEETIRVRVHRARVLLKDVLHDHADAFLTNVFAFGGVRCDRMLRRVLAAITALESSTES